jgi:hypothetical protein
MEFTVGQALLPRRPLRREVEGRANGVLGAVSHKQAEDSAALPG